MARTPTKRTLDECRRHGWFCAVAEHWDHWAKKRRDLFGWIDVVAIHEHGIIGIQATTDTNMNARIDKLLSSASCQAWVCSIGTAEVWGWDREGDLHVSRIEIEIQETHSGN